MFVMDETITNIGIHFQCKMPVWFQELNERTVIKIQKNHKNHKNRMFIFNKIPAL
jgi:hypothetical protein